MSEWGMALVAYAANHGECHNIVVRDGAEEPCERPAVAVRIDPEGGPYPVCRRHVRHPMVGLADIVAAIKGAS